jgi:hypothetical protein
MVIRRFLFLALGLASLRPAMGACFSGACPPSFPGYSHVEPPSAHFTLHCNLGAAANYAAGVVSSSDLSDVTTYAEAAWTQYANVFKFTPRPCTPTIHIVLKLRSHCSGYTCRSDDVYIEISTLCFICGPKWVKKVVGHEIFHVFQDGYTRGEAEWIMEGTARAMEDDLFTDIDEWPDSLCATCDNMSFNKQVDSYLKDANVDITFNFNSASAPNYSSALFWKYFSEQYATPTSTTLPGLVPEVNPFLMVWQKAPLYQDIDLVNHALIDLTPPGQPVLTFNDLFRRFTLANWVKNLGDPPLPKPSLSPTYRYLDDAPCVPCPSASCNPTTCSPCPAYGNVQATDLGTVSSGGAVTNAPLTVEKSGAVYYTVKPGTGCPVITATFQRAPAEKAFYHALSQTPTALKERYEGSAEKWVRSFLTPSSDTVVAITGALDNSAKPTVTFTCSSAHLEIKLPNTNAVAVLDRADPAPLVLCQVLVTDPVTGKAVPNLPLGDFVAKLDGTVIPVGPGGFVQVQEQYWFKLQAPAGLPAGLHDLEIALQDSSLTMPISLTVGASPQSVKYQDSTKTDQVLVIDVSGSMVDGDKIVAARKAANFYVDITRDKDRLAVVPFDATAASMQFDLKPLNFTTTRRVDASNYINLLTPGTSTSIGAGLQGAVNQLNGVTPRYDHCSIVLLSDGMENTSPYWDKPPPALSVKGIVQATHCPVTTIAFGPESNETLMEQIATDTGGSSYYNDVFVSPSPLLPGGGAAPSADAMALELAVTYESAQAQGEGRYRLLAEKGQVPEPMVKQIHPFMVDATVSELLVALVWNDDTVGMQLQLRKPDLSVLDAVALPEHFGSSTAGRLGGRIASPAPGAWEMWVTRSSGEHVPVEYRVIASGHTSLNLDLLLPDRLGFHHQTGQRVPIYAILSAPTGVTGASVIATVTAPDGAPTKLVLFDDGDHGDGLAGDGLWANDYTRVNQTSIVAPAEEPNGNPVDPQDEGAYRVVVRASGPDFQREAQGSFSVLAAPDANDNGLPDTFELENGVSDPAGDPDGDGLDNLAEYLRGTNPWISDTDGGGESDGSEAVDPAQEPLDSSDDRIKAPAFFKAELLNGQVLLSYDVKPGHDHFILLRATDPAGPWTQPGIDLPLDGLTTDTTAANDQTFYYRLQAVDAAGHKSAVLHSEPVTPRSETAGLWKRCDFDGSGIFDITDAVDILGFLFNGLQAPCEKALDCNADTVLDITDPVSLLNYLFLGGPIPGNQPSFGQCEPFEGCPDAGCQ